MTTTSTLDLRQRLADTLTAEGAARSAWVHRAFAEVPREVFVPRFHRPLPDGSLVEGADPDQRQEWLAQVYTDQVLVVQRTHARDVQGAVGVPTSSSSQPSVMAGMLEALDLQPRHRVLEIGTGTGYNAALLCQRVGAGNVTTVELDPALADAARECLASLGLHPRVCICDGAAGVAETAPFDRIIATASIDHVPPAWINQLSPGGVVVADLRGGLAGGLIRLAAPPDSEAEVGAVHGRFLELPGAFMPMRNRVGVAYRDGEAWESVVYDRRNPQRTRTAVDPGHVADNPSLRFLLQLHLSGRGLRDFRRTIEGDELGGRASDGSWCSVSTRAAAEGRFAVEQAGPRRLWDSVEAAYSTWRDLGKPGIDRFGVTAYDDADRQYVWFERDNPTYRWPLPL